MTTPLPDSPAAERNKQPILDALRRLLPARGRLLEIAGGTGQHALHLAAGLPGWHWQASDLDPQRVAAIAARIEDAADDALRARLAPPLRLDVLAWPWPVPDAAFDAIYCANMLHAAPWPCCAGLMRGAARHLAPGGQLITYGAYLEADRVTAPSNLEFDADLRLRGPGWGLRDLDAVRTEARAAGLDLAERIEMPSNNLLLVWRAAPQR